MIEHDETNIDINYLQVKLSLLEISNSSEKTIILVDDEKTKKPTNFQNFSQRLNK